MCAKTSCPLNNLTRNIVPARTEEISPSTSTALSSVSFVELVGGP
jgi:hypothetical protein